MVNKVDTYSIKQYLTSKLGLLVLFIVCSVSLFANDENNLKGRTAGFITGLTDIELVQDKFQLLKNVSPKLGDITRIELSSSVLKKAKYYYEGAGKSKVEDLQSGYLDDVLVDVIVEPRSVKKKCFITAQSDGENGYRLIQDRRDVIFEIVIDGSLHKVTASDVLEKGESVYLTAYCKSGNIGVLVNGKVPVKEVFQVNGEKIAKLKKLGVEPTIINHLSAIEDDVFYKSSDLKKKLRKQIGRRAYKKYGEEIVQVAYDNVVQSSSCRSALGKMSVADVPLLVGSDFSGIIEQIRIWQPAKARSLTSMDYENNPEDEGKLSAEEKSEVELKLESIQTSVKSVASRHNIEDQLILPIRKARITSIALPDTEAIHGQNFPTNFGQKSIDNSLTTSSIGLNYSYLTGDEKLCIDLNECFCSETKGNDTQLFQIQQKVVNLAGEKQVSTFLDVKNNGALAAGVDVWNSEAVNYDNNQSDAYLQKLLADNIIFEGKELKFTFDSNNQFTTQVKGRELFEEQKVRCENKLSFYINDRVNFVFNGSNSPADRTFKINDSEKVRRSTGNVKSEWVSVINEYFEKNHDSIKCKSLVEICPGDAVNYVSHDAALFNRISDRQPVNWILGCAGNRFCEIQKVSCEGLQTWTDFIALKRSRTAALGYHNCDDFLSLLASERSYGSVNSNFRLVSNQAIVSDNYLKNYLCGGFGLRKSYQNDGKRFAVDTGPPVRQNDNCFYDFERNWNNNKFEDRGGRSTVGGISGLSILEDELIGVVRSYSVKLDSRDENDIEPSPPPEWWQFYCSTGRVNGRHDIRGVDSDAYKLLYVSRCVV